AGLSLVVGLILGGLLGDAVGLVAMLSMAAILRIAGGLFVFAFMPRTAVTTGPAQAESATPPDAEPAVTTEVPGPQRSRKRSSEPTTISRNESPPPWPASLRMCSSLPLQPLCSRQAVTSGLLTS